MFVASEGIKIGVVGHKGRMGSELLSVIRDKKMVAIIDEDKSKLFDLSDVVIDFSSPDGLKECLGEVRRTKTTFVSGTTPVSDDLYAEILDISKDSKICWSSNMSIGIAIVKKMSYMLGQILSGNDYDCEILEKHHNQKLDVPSGTAKTIGQEIAKGRNIDFNSIAVFGRNAESGKRKVNDIVFSSIRGGNIFGEHDIMFIGKDDEIIISHKAFNRKLFAVGALNCALKLLRKEENGFYLVEDLI